MADEDALRLKVSDILQLQPIGREQASRHKVKVIGYLVGESLVVTAPQTRNGLLLVREGQMFNVRMLEGSSAQGFVSTVLHSYAKPYPHLHLSYPHEVETILVRNAQRVSSHLLVAVRNLKDEDTEKSYYPAYINDISLTGAHLVSKRRLGHPDTMLQLNLLLQVCAEEVQLVLLAIVRSETQRDSGDGGISFHYGVQFQSLNRFQRVLLHGYVLENMLKER